MKTIGMLGGLSWESTISYYQAINEGIRAELGGLSSAKIYLYSVNFEEIEQLQHTGKWAEAATLLANAAKSLEASGADFLIICANTMHKVAPEIEDELTIPLLHIADAAAEKLTAEGITKIGLLGTRFTMEQDFYKNRLTESSGIEVLIPHEDEREIIHQVIYDELCQGSIRPESREKYVEIIQSLHDRGAEAILLGCTEIALLVQQEHTTVPLYNTTQIHSDATVKWALSTPS